MQKGKVYWPALQSDEVWELSASMVRSPFCSSSSFRIESSPYRYTVRAGGVKTLLLVREICDAIGDTQPENRLVSSRPAIREVRSIGYSPLLIFIAQHAKDRQIQKVAIWLRSLTSGTEGADTVASLGTSSDEQLRRLVARTLVRIRAWPQVKRMLQHERCPAIRRILSKTSRPDFGQSLTRFCDSLQTRKVRASRRNLFLDPTVELKVNCPAKPSGWIRILLIRITKAVRGEASDRAN